jgi:hypothetical protein
MSNCCKILRFRVGNQWIPLLGSKNSTLIGSARFRACIPFDFQRFGTWSWLAILLPFLLKLICSTLHNRLASAESLNVGLDRGCGRWTGKVSLVVEAYDLGGLILLDLMIAEMKRLGGSGGWKGAERAAVICLVLHGDKMVDAWCVASVLISFDFVSGIIISVEREKRIHDKRVQIQLCLRQKAQPRENQAKTMTQQLYLKTFRLSVEASPCYSTDDTIVAIPPTRFSSQYKTNYVCTIAFRSCAKTASSTASLSRPLTSHAPLLGLVPSLKVLWSLLVL